MCSVSDERENGLGSSRSLEVLDQDWVPFHVGLGDHILFDQPS